jgi:hypothetical protein
MEDACLCQVGREKGSRSFAFGWPRVGELRGVMGFIIWAGPSITWALLFGLGLVLP